MLPYFERYVTTKQCALIYFVCFYVIRKHVCFKTKSAADFADTVTWRLYS